MKRLLPLLLLAGCGSSDKKPDRSLYDRLGGTYGISAVADDFVDRVYMNKALYGNKRVGEALVTVPRPGFKFHVIALLVKVTGGPDGYHGRTLLDSHKHLNITENDWNEVVEDFVASLEHIRVGKKEQDELITIVATTKADVVSRNPPFEGTRPELPKPTGDSLYARLGGDWAIASVVDDFIERLLVNDTLNENPKIATARERVPKSGLKFQVTALLCELTGGPHKYSGRSMKDSHAHLDITNAQWDAMVKDFKSSLEKFGVPEREQKELFDIVGSTKADIVK